MSGARVRRGVSLAAAALLALGSGCRSIYWSDRAADARDVLTVAVGLGLGAKARVGPLQLPLIIQSDYAGLRSGEWFASAMREDFWTYVAESGHVLDQPIPHYYRDYLALCSGYETFDPGGAAAERRKRINAVGISLVGVDQDPKNISYYTQVEAVAGLAGSLRLGVNPGELLDALLGFAGVDFMADDVGGRAKHE